MAILQNVQTWLFIVPWLVRNLVSLVSKIVPMLWNLKFTTTRISAYYNFHIFWTHFIYEQILQMFLQMDTPKLTKSDVTQQWVEVRRWVSFRHCTCCTKWRLKVWPLNKLRWIKIWNSNQSFVKLCQHLYMFNQRI